MLLFDVSVFGGMNPRTAPAKLDSSQAQTARNAHLESGDLEPLRQLLVTETLQGVVAAKNVYRYRDNWLNWTTEVDIVTSPVVEDSYDRIYITGDGAPKMSSKDDITTDAQGNAALTTYPLGLPAPTTAPTVGHTGGSAANETRAYVYTFVTKFGEEGPPSSAGSHTAPSDATWNITGMDTAPSGYSHVTAKRIYRSTSGTYQYVDEVAIATTSYNDTTAAADLAEEIPSTNWDAPPSGLTGIVALPGGFFAGFSGRTLYFSEPWYPHAWPTSYELAVNFDIVGLGVTGTTLIVTTEADPFIVSCPDPAIASMDRWHESVPCLSKRGIVSTQGGVIYPASDGLVLANANGVTRITAAEFTRRDWADYYPSTILAFGLDGKYIGFYEDSTNGDAGFIFDPGEAASFQEVGIHGVAGVVVPEDDDLYIAYRSGSNTDIAAWEGNDDLSYLAEWKSKVFITPEPTNLSAAQVISDDPSDVDDATQAALMAQYETALLSGDYAGALGTYSLGEICVGGDLRDFLFAAYTSANGVTFYYYADGELKHTEAVADADPFPLPSGFLARKHEFQINANINVQRVAMATSAEELLA